ncbi:MAG: metallophosphoesterase [Thermoplasmatota archaeon]
MRKIPWVILVLPVMFLSLLLGTAESQDQVVLITNMEVVTVTQEEAVVTWVTNIETTSEVDYGENETLGNTAASEGETRYHYVRIHDLEPETGYFFQVSSGGTRGGMSSFTTLPPLQTAPSARIALLADVHYDVDGVNMPNGAMYGDSVNLHQAFLEEMSQRGDIDGVILLGDNVQGSEEDYSDFYTAMDSSGVQFYPVMGNWDKSEAAWEDHFDNYVGMDSTYYSIDAGGLHIVVLDSTVPGSVGGSIDEVQLEWLQDDLDENPDSKVLIFMHHLYFEDDIMGLDQASYEGLENAINGHGNVLSVFSGHNHQNSYAQYIPTCRTTIASLVQYPNGYATLDIHPDGYSQSYWKVESALEISENSRMRIKASSVDTEADQQFLGTIEERNHVLEPVEPVENDPPVILSIYLEAELIGPGEHVDLSVNAYDPEGEELEYIYAAEEGTIVGDGPLATYTAPDYEGAFYIEVKVFDGVLYSNPYFARIEVEEEPVVNENRAPEVDRVVATPQSVLSGGNVSLRTIASDPDGDPLEYTYYCAYGQIIGEGNEVIWKAPERTGLHVISVQVSDGELISNAYMVEIEVYEEEGQPADDSPFFPLPIIILFAAIIVLSLIAWERRKRT